MVVFVGVRDRGSGGDRIDRPSLEPLTLPGMKTNGFEEGRHWFEGSAKCVPNDPYYRRSCLKPPTLPMQPPAPLVQPPTPPVQPPAPLLKPPTPPLQPSPPLFEPPPPYFKPPTSCRKADPYRRNCRPP
uniref:Uncharacterized protein n=1 Tax=Fagus sylvatica TaxID=28930 RepID=A0A2N9FCM7_FAGSY